jgi:hypothetical protein
MDGRLSVEESEALVLPDRPCNGCTLCCKLISVKPLNKPAGVLCTHCTGKGCGIYADRPEICRAWSCGWRMWAWLGPEWYPRKSRMVINHVGFSHDPGKSFLEIFVDPGFPGRWREPRYLGTIRRIARMGWRGDGVLPSTRSCVVDRGVG